MKHKRRALFNSLISLLLCFSMLVGTTFAWFTDSVSSGNNTIAAGNLNVELEYWNAEAREWQKVNEGTQVLDPNALWEPGYTEVAYLKITNAGDLALKYHLGVGVREETGSINVEGNSFFLSDYIQYGLIESDSQVLYTSREDARNALPSSKLISAGNLNTDAKALNQKNETRYVTLVVYMPEEVGNGANHVTGVNPPEIKLGIELVATQAEYESDSFGMDYDSTAGLKTFNFPGTRIEVTVSAGVTTNGANQTVDAVSLADDQSSASVPAGVLLDAGTKALTLQVNTKDSSDANLTLGENEEMVAMDVHIDGVSPENTVPMEITIKEAAPKGLNMGNYRFYHVENGETKEMTLVENGVGFTAHNQFKYNPETGDITLYMATFSEVAVVADTKNTWKGEFDYSWYTNANARSETTEHIIANADQLAAFGAIVGGMAEGIEQDSFSGKTVSLIANVDLGAVEGNTAKLIFYPIGYNSSDGKYEKTGVAVTTGFYNFCGTFDGNGHTVANFYQNTWEMKGDNNYYDASLQYYRDGMGLFGRVYGGTIKNLTVKNFKSDGEYTTTGCIAAYADGATFENIAIVDCNPRVYNIGNGGIVGCVGWYAKEGGLKTTFKNITVDNSNKISALWGSYDVACGGIVGQYYPTSGQSVKNAGVELVNCHVSAQIDVYNDVCANYQYYAYRYAGMIIGSIRENTTNEEGKTIPNMTGISATGCTANFGTWNDYYYCELVDNTTASYTHDYQMSRLTEVKAINGTTVTYLDDSTGTVPASGRANYVIVDYTKGHGTTNATCYHFKDGKVWNHADGGEETINGVVVLKEDKQHLYLEFNNLFTGYGWGVSSIGLKEYSGIVTDLDITEGDQEESEYKFYVKSSVTGISENNDIKLGDLFDIFPGAKISTNAVKVSATRITNDNEVVALTVVEKTDWRESTVSVSDITDRIEITIQDYKFCKPTTAVFVDGQYEPNGEVGFTKKFTSDKFTYRVGNGNDVSISSLFEAKNDAVGKVAVEINEVSASAKYTHSENWKESKIRFNGSGIVEVTIRDSVNIMPVTLKLEVVDAVNATSATSATSNNVVLLNDCGFSSLEVGGGYTLYGNGFTMTCGSDSPALDMGYAFVTLNNGTLDNVQIVTPNFDYAVLYKSNMTESGNRSETTDRTRYFNVKSGVMVSGNSQIMNSRISGARAAVNVTGGNVLIDNSRIERGAVASILVGAANSLTLRDVTLMQKPTDSTYKDDKGNSKTLMGFSVLLVCDANGNAAPVTLEGTLVQNAWVDENDKQYVPSAGESIISTVMAKTDYLHDIDGDGTNESLNLGIAYMPESVTSKVNTTTITDNRTDKNSVPYDYAEVSILNGKTYVYSYKNTNGTADSFKTESAYAPNKQNDIITVTYSDNADGLESGKSLGTDGWVYELNVDLDKLSGYALDFSKLSMNVNGITVTDFKVNGEAKPASPVAVTAGGVTYTLTATVNGKEYTATYKVTGTETSKESPSLVEAKYEAGLCVASSYGGTWSGAAPALQGVKIKYWSVAEKQYKTINLSDYTPTTKGQLNGTNNTWTYTPANGDFTLTLTGGQVHSSNKVNAMPVVCDGKLYFVAAKSNGLVNSGNSARSVPVSYTFKDNNGGDVLTFSNSWSVAENKDAQYKYSDFCNGTLTILEASSGCVTPDTLITLADGSQVRVDSLTGKEELLVWNLETGKYDTAPIVFVDNDAEQAYEIIHLYFSDGSDVKVISEHGFFDLDLGKYVYIDANNYAEYVGHRFVTEGDIASGSWNIVTLDQVVLESEVTTAWSPVTFGHLCYYTNGVLSMPGGIEGLFNIFEVDTDIMCYDEEQMRKDIETYGLLTVEDFGGMITEEAFNAFNGAYLQIAMAKGLLTWEDIAYMAERYIPLM